MPIHASLQPDESPQLGNADQFRILVEGVTDYALYMLQPDGTIASWNSGAERIKGYSAAEIIGRHFSTFYTEEDRAAGEPQLALGQARTHGRYEKEAWRVRSDGSRFWASVVIDPIRDDQGELIGFAKITRDITERREAELSLEAARRTMLEAQKMEAIGQLTYGVAHDFNNLLTVITNSLDLIAIDPSDVQRSRRLIAGAQRAADRGARLTQQLLTFSRRQELKPEPQDVNSLIYRSEAMLRRACGEAFEIEFSLGNGLGQVEVDVPGFEAALLNLLVNARDAMPRGGRIRVVTRALDREGTHPAAAADHRDGQYVCVAVEDQGTGMLPEVKARALDPFFTTKEVGKGSGLGLSQVYGFVSQSGGNVEIDTEAGVGTSVRFCLPVVAPAVDAGDTGAPSKVLLVEDDSDLQTVAVEALRHMGYAVLTAGDAVAALEVLERDPEIDVLFSDVVMPKNISGIDLARQAMALRPGIRVLLASGYSIDQLPSFPPGCAFIPKPYRFEDLQARLESMGED